MSRIGRTFAGPLIAALLVLSGPTLGGCATINVTGLPDWLKPAVTRSLSAVYGEIPDMPDVDREGTLAIVATRLFAGYDVSVSVARGGPAVSFSPKETAVWSVGLVMPELRDMALRWFDKDVAGMEGELISLLGTMPGAALTWADEALRDAIGAVVARRLPGWDFSIQAALGSGEAKLTVSFRPRQPLVLSIRPSMYSSTIPAMFQSDLEVKLTADLSPLIGLPVDWAALHRDGIEEAARAFLQDRNTVENMKAEASVVFVPGVTSKIDAVVDSDRFRFSVWVAAYAGLDERYPEVGVHFGWNARKAVGVPIELYGEAVADLDDFGVKRRLGARIELFDNFWAGAELEWPDDLLFWRVQWGPGRVRRPYLWWRWNDGAGHECAIGYRFDGHISVELYYDGIESDKIGIRGLWSL